MPTVSLFTAALSGSVLFAFSQSVSCSKFRDELRWPSGDLASDPANRVNAPSRQVNKGLHNLSGPISWLVKSKSFLSGVWSKHWGSFLQRKQRSCQTELKMLYKTETSFKTCLPRDRENFLHFSSQAQIIKQQLEPFSFNGKRWGEFSDRVARRLSESIRNKEYVHLRALRNLGAFMSWTCL